MAKLNLLPQSLVHVDLHSSSDGQEFGSLRGQKVCTCRWCNLSTFTIVITILHCAGSGERHRIRDNGGKNQLNLKPP